jgi:nucleolysin TIA-1/TIAR
VPGLSLAGLAAYERQLALSKMNGAHALMQQQNQHVLKQTAMGMGALGAGYGAGFPNAAATQHLNYVLSVKYPTPYGNQRCLF